MITVDFKYIHDIINYFVSFLNNNKYKKYIY